MRLVPCILCSGQAESDNNKALAKICENCLKSDNLTSILKNIDLKKFKEITNKNVKLTKDGELI